MQRTVARSRQSNMGTTGTMNIMALRYLSVVGPVTGVHSPLHLHKGGVDSLVAWSLSLDVGKPGARPRSVNRENRRESTGSNVVQRRFERHSWSLAHDLLARLAGHTIVQRPGNGGCKAVRFWDCPCVSLRDMTHAAATIFLLCTCVVLFRMNIAFMSRFTAPKASAHTTHYSIHGTVTMPRKIPNGCPQA